MATTPFRANLSKLRLALQALTICTLSIPSFAAAYNIGRGQAYANISSLDGGVLQPSDTVRIHNGTNDSAVPCSYVFEPASTATHLAGGHATAKVMAGSGCSARISSSAGSLLAMDSGGAGSAMETGPGDSKPDSSVLENASSGPVAGACSGMSLGNGASLNGFVPFPRTNAWNTNIAGLTPDPNSATIVAASGFAGNHLHPDFGSEAYYGIPYVVVDSTVTPSVPINVIDYAGQSDVVVAPYPITAPIEGGPADCSGWPDTYNGDAHVLVLDRAKCFLYETFNTNRCNGLWNASSETIWDMNNYESRPYGWTSADAAGLSIFTGLVRYDEVLSGAIHHAIRFTLPATKNDANGGYFVLPATHAAGVYWGVDNIIGMRIRLKASFDISGYSPINQVILTAMQQYGMILADNGSYFYFQGASDPRWDDDDLANLANVQSLDFEVMPMTPEYPGWDAATAPTGAPPVINSFTASATSVASGSPVTFTYSVTGDSYDYVDMIGPVTASSGSVTIYPTATQTYTLNSVNAYSVNNSITSTPITVTVTGSVVAPPVFTPAAGKFSSAETLPTVSISTPTSPSATICYTTDGSTPTTQSTVFSISNPIKVSATETLEAIAVVNGYSAPSAVTSATYTISASAPQNQVIALPAEPNVPLGTAPFTLLPSSMIYPTPYSIADQAYEPTSTGLTVALASSTPSVCTVVSSTAVVTLLAAGTCTIQATQAGNSTYAAAPPVHQSFQVLAVGTESQTITFGTLANETLGAAPFTVSATASSGLTVSFASTTTSVCTVSTATVSLVVVGTCTIQATQAGNGTYAAATPVNQSFQVTQASSSAPAIHSLSPASAAPGGAAFTLTVNGTSFVSGATVDWNGTALETTFVSATQLTASVPAALIASAGMATVTVVNPGAVTSGGVGFPIQSGPAATAVSPGTGNGTSQTFTFTFSDPSGYQNLGVLDVLINNYLDGIQACYIALVPSGANAGTLYLVDDGGDAGGPFAGYMALPGTGSVSNSQCTVNATGSSVVGSGTTITLTLNIGFSASFTGNRIFYTAARDTGTGNSGWQALSTWQVPAAPATPTQATGVTPASGSGASQSFVFTFADSAGWQDLGVVDVLFNNFIDGIQGCYIAYSVPSATLYLVDDGGDAGGPFAGYLALPGTGSMSNSQCTVSGVGSSAAGSGNTLTLTLNISFSSSFAGNRIFYTAAGNAAGTENSGWQALGAWTVP